MHQLIHNGIIVPAPPAPVGLSIRIDGRTISMTPFQEEMAMAWARKKGTSYEGDPTFQANFLSDFLPALGITTPVTIEEIDFTACIRVVNKERYHNSHMSKDERKVLAAERKTQREALKARYGYAIVDGQRVELGNYMAEPSGLFMGRGQHPLRGRWKQGASHEDITLNLSPDAPQPEGRWKEIVWQPDSLWVARWDDKLSGKTKYVWLADTSPAKQTREAGKFDKALRLQDRIAHVRAEIEQGLTDEKPRTRMIATACFLIDALCLRVGDEKDPDEADTVGATTLRPEHVKFLANGKVEFRFLGKDSVEWRKKINLPQQVRANLEELVRDARPSSSGTGLARDLPQLFPDIDSSHVNRYLSGILPGLSAKVFRTFRATDAVSESLEASGVRNGSPEHIKWQAVAQANLRAAELCNHTKQAGVNWSAVQSRYQDRLEKAQARQQAAEASLDEAKLGLQALRQELQLLLAEEMTDALTNKVKRLRTRIESARGKVALLVERKERASLAVGKLKSQMAIAKQKRTWNLSTSLKSYIDPRVYHRWGEQVDYDVLARYYPTILQRKFAWVRLRAEEAERAGSRVVVARTCLQADVPKIATVFSAVLRALPNADLSSDPMNITEKYLPALERPWCETVAAFGEDGQAVGMAVLGPERQEGKEYLLDVFGLVLPGELAAPAAEALADELQSRFRTFQAQNPKREYVLKPANESWLEYAPELAEYLGFIELDSEVGESAEVADPQEAEAE